MKADELTSDHVVRLVRHLFDPDAPPSRSSTRRLISPDVVFDFPALPPNDSNVLKRDARVKTTGKTVIQRHPTAAQALSAFHLPAIVANHVPGAHWSLSIDNVFDVSATKAGSSWIEPQARVWRATIVWTLQFRPPVALPYGLSSKVLVQHTDTRTVELWFWGEGEFEPKQRYERQYEPETRAGPSVMSSLSPFDVYRPETGRIRLRLVKYSGVELPAIIKLLPWYDMVAHVLPLALGWILAPVYGALLLLGLDRSTRSLDSSKKNHKRQARRRLRQELSRMYQEDQDRRLRFSKEFEFARGKGKRKVVPTHDDGSEYAAESPAASESSIDSSFFGSATTTFDTPPTPPFIDLPDVPSEDVDDRLDVLSCLSSLGESSSEPDRPPTSSYESFYHHLMRQTHSRLTNVWETVWTVCMLLKQAQQEAGLVGQLMGQCVRMFALVWLNVLNVGAEKVLKSMRFTSETIDALTPVQGDEDDENDEDEQLQHGFAGLWWTSGDVHKRRDRLKDHVRQKVEAQFQSLPNDDQAEEEHLWRSQEQPQRKSVSFSLQDAFNPYDDNDDESDLDMAKFKRRPTLSEARLTIDEESELSTTSSSSNKSSNSFNTNQGRLSSRAVAEPSDGKDRIRERAPARYHNDFGLPSLATSTLFGWQRMRVARQAAVEAVKRRPKFERTYSKDDGRVLTIGQSTLMDGVESDKGDRAVRTDADEKGLGQRLGPDHGMDHVAGSRFAEEQDEIKLVKELVSKQSDSDQGAEEPFKSLSTSNAVTTALASSSHFDGLRSRSSRSSSPSSPASVMNVPLHPFALATAIEYSSMPLSSRVYSPTLSTSESLDSTPALSPELPTGDRREKLVTSIDDGLDTSDDGAALPEKAQNLTMSTKQQTIKTDQSTTLAEFVEPDIREQSLQKGSSGMKNKKRSSLSKAVGKVWLSHSRNSSGSLSKSAWSADQADRVSGEEMKK
ncbi:hypothetical protein OIV83_005772 [Microbotryomycetes sp. JL201]|nr:hypothetical protein OIV83_005772 [Microbotryomycetes sp. JL201]